MTQQKLDFRGGRRPGAGRKRIGENRSIRITLPLETWQTIENAAHGEGKKLSEKLRELIINGVKYSE